MVVWIIVGVALASFVAVIVWTLRWKDSSWTEEEQNKAFSWSKKGSGER